MSDTVVGGAGEISESEVCGTAFCDGADDDDMPVARIGSAADVGDTSVADARGLRTGGRSAAWCCEVDVSGNGGGAATVAMSRKLSHTIKKKKKAHVITGL